MKENNEEIKKGRRDTFLDGLKQRRADAGADEIDWEDPEARYGAIEDEYNANQEELTRHRENNAKLNNMFAENPNSAYFMNDLINGENAAVTLTRNFGDVFQDAILDPTEENVKALADAMDEYRKRLKQSEEAEMEFQQNAAQSRSDIDAWKQQNNLSDDQVSQAMDFIDEQFQNLLVGKTTPELLDFALKAQNFDSAVAEATEEGRKEGRGEQLTEQLKKPTNGDGMPAASGTAPADAMPQQDNFLRGARKKDPWADAKRSKY